MDKLVDLISDHKEELAVIGISTLAIQLYLRHHNQKSDT